MDRVEFLYSRFISCLGYEPTPCQDSFLHDAAGFISDDDHDIMVVNGYAGTGKTTALSAVIMALKDFGVHCVLLAPTGRAAKVLSGYAGQPAYTIHKHIYRQKSVGGDGFGQFSLAPNKDKDTLYIVDEVSLIGIDTGQVQHTGVFGSGNLLEDLVSFVRNGADNRLMLVGDAAQLPPVGLDASPALSREYMDMVGGAMYSELVTVVRQQAGSGILRNATIVREHISCGSCLQDGFSLKLVADGYPDVERVDGGELIEDFWIRFVSGKAAECGAKKNEELLKRIIGMDEGASYLGECALVPYDSPINQTGILFYNTLFDENACCHLALGRGYSNTIENFEKLTRSDFLELGVNDSSVHVDFMIGAEDLEIIGVTRERERVRVFENGTWSKALQ